MKRLVIFLLLLLTCSNVSIAATYLGKKLDGIPLKCSLTTIDNSKTYKNLTCIFHENMPRSIELKFDKKDKKIYRFNSTNGELLNLSRIAIYKTKEGENDQHNFDIYGVLKISPPKK